MNRETRLAGELFDNDRSQMIDQDGSMADLLPMVFDFRFPSGSYQPTDHGQAFSPSLANCFRSWNIHARIGHLTG